MQQERYDAFVVGAGFGGLGAALRLSEGGARVALVETLNYPGGCAGTFMRSGYRFEAGATLSSGLSPDQLFGKWNQKYDLGIVASALDPVIDMRIGEHNLLLHSDQDHFVDSLCARDFKNAAAIRRFFAIQKRVADVFWPLFETPEALPPFSLAALMPLLKIAPQMFSQLSILNASLFDVVKRCGAHKSEALRVFLDALCQITVQCSSKEASAPIALSALAFPWRGSRHVEGGIGNLAQALVTAAKQNGVDVYFTERAKSLSQTKEGFALTTRKRTLTAPFAVLNLLPKAAQDLCSGALEKKVKSNAPFEAVNKSWGAVMSYAVVRPPPTAPEKASHLQIVSDESLPFNEGNHVFLSISAASEHERAPPGFRTMTLSTHFNLGGNKHGHFSASREEQQQRVEWVQKKMLETAQNGASEWFENVEFIMTGSPRTFERFTGRPEGRVGGPPRLAGALGLLRAPRYEVAERVFLVGDSMSPGQSTYACAIGGVRVADTILQRL